MEEEISFGLRQQVLPKVRAADRAAMTLRDFGKSHWASTNIAAFSQGQKHLVCMMAIIAMKPRLIILDELFRPCTHDGVQKRQDFMRGALPA